MVNFTSKDIETKMHTTKINQGNIALKSNFFEDAKLKILMILCESPNPKELHKPISTLEYGAKAKGIAHGTQTPVKDKIFSQMQRDGIVNTPNFEAYIM
ncbi:hypothetical protein RJ641_004797 [Dillenia turbinata]|uniref:Uncharacterized protein n=1 Tax=Dillenia turbinata TaxID=194707 RepID=A0AAN8VN29_9MAGN